MSIIDSYTIQTMPKTLLFIGATGCGKHTIAHYLSEKLDLEYSEIENNVTAADIENFLYGTVNTLYVIDLTKFSEKQQNQFLKFIEEPTKSVYIVLTANSEAGILNTILNRCTKHIFEEYTKQEVGQIINAAVDDLAFTIFKTPGKLFNLSQDSLNNVLDLANNVVFNIATYTYPRTLAIATKINYKDLYNKVDLNLFFDAVSYIAFEDYKTNSTKNSLTVFLITNQFKHYITQQNIIKETLMLNYLTMLWEAVRQ